MKAMTDDINESVIINRAKEETYDKVRVNE